LCSSHLHVYTNTDNTITLREIFNLLDENLSYTL
jgi:hypothetical protein